MGEPDRQNPPLPDDPEFGYRAALSRRAYARASLTPLWLLVAALVALAIWALVR